MLSLEENAKPVMKLVFDAMSVIQTFALCAKMVNLSQEGDVLTASLPAKPVPLTTLESVLLAQPNSLLSLPAPALTRPAMLQTARTADKTTLQPAQYATTALF